MQGNCERLKKGACVVAHIRRQNNRAVAWKSHTLGKAAVRRYANGASLGA